ncbi:hypothetical protein CDD82_7774 [Ophiocordyceps australis]|uniref:Outer spore wall protein RRT8 n=1 Tax=Ophiocordyceps australis TaxID=1399860 RepID=A0A2C5YKY3_9HYPO|nr:hypothetical protein CDD82_7774 [Ophiocordyceps australis]
MADPPSCTHQNQSPESSRHRHRLANSLGEKAQQVLKDDYSKARLVAFDALKSRAFLYPFKGIVYFLGHRSLWQPFISRLGPFATLSASVIAGMFTLTYLPQLAVQVFVSGPFAVVSTVLLVLSESSAIINVIARTWLLQDAILDTFDGTLLSRNATAVLREGREIKPGRDPMQKLGKIIKSPFKRFTPKALIRYLIYLPLNFVPLVGTVMFIYLQGRNRGRQVHGRYFQLKKWSTWQQKDWLNKHVGAYTAFGLVATFLEMIPLASIFFTYTNAVGAALWAADIETLNASMTDGTAPGLRETAKEAE